ncbi:MAG: endonuclease [Gammaproteobacteria bacterium]|nr:MAG: endonuclease [Gammaproteobacteria bacterium]
MRTRSLTNIFFISLLFANPLATEELSLMSYNVENLFDTEDDFLKDDKAFLPVTKKKHVYHIGACNKIEVKKWRDECLYLDWSEEAKTKKILNIAKVISSLNSDGADIIAFQEIENINVLKDLFNQLEPLGYIDFVLLEGRDYRGIDSAIISKFPIKRSKLHFIKFSPGFPIKDTRPILEAQIDLLGKTLRVYSVHFPAPFLNSVMRKDAFIHLENLVNSHDDPAVAMGDFNVTSEEETELGTFKDQSKTWYVSHYQGCANCKGTYYYQPKDDWSFLDAILVSKGRGVNFNTSSIDVLINDTNAYKDSFKPKGFDAVSMEGVSDHFPVIAKVNFSD